MSKYWYCFILGPFFMTLEACGEFIIPFINANIINHGAATGNVPYIVEHSIYMLLIAAAMLANINSMCFSIKIGSLEQSEYITDYNTNNTFH